MSSESVRAEDLSDFALRALATIAVPSEHARIIADSLVEADLRGIYSHGNMALPRYWRGLRAGDINASPKVRTVGGKGPIAIFDGDNGLGCVVGSTAMATAIQRARDLGVGISVARNSNHFGAAGFYATMALSEGMIGMATSNAPPVMAPWGGRDVVLGNNPIAWAIPAGKGLPLVLDMACTAVARGKLRVAIAHGEQIPINWATGPDGLPTDDPAVALSGMLMPAGTYKGYGLAVIMEALAGILPGANFLSGVPAATALNPQSLASWGIGHFFMAFDIGVFMPIDEFGRRVDQLIQKIKSTSLAKGFDAVFLPGEIEYRNKTRQLASGITLAEATLGDLRALAAEIGIDFARCK